MSSRRAGKTAAAEGRKHDKKKLNTGYSRKARTVSAAACGADTTIYAAGTYWEMTGLQSVGNNNAFGDREQQAA